MGIRNKIPTSFAIHAAVPSRQMRRIYDASFEVPEGWVNQFLYMAHLYDRIQGVDGDIVECGLGEGTTFSMLAFFSGSENHRPVRRLYGFDSFEGFPAPDSLDCSPRKPQEGEWGPEDRGVTEESVRRRLADSGISDEFPELDIRIVKGFLRDSLSDFPRDRPIAFCHLDVDLYEGYRDALRHLFPRVAPGGVIAFDEYREFHPELSQYRDERGVFIEKWPGCTKAVDDYFADLEEVLRYHGPTRKYYIVKGSI